MSTSLYLFRHSSRQVRFALALVCGIGMSFVGCATSPSAPPTVNVTGRWTGQCFGCQATGFTLMLSQNDGDVTGTVIAAGRHAFGDSEKPILAGKVSGNQLSFQVKGDPGDLWFVDIAVKSDGNTMEGTGNYRGSFGLRFTRAGR